MRLVLRGDVTHFDQPLPVHAALSTDMATGSGFAGYRLAGTFGVPATRPRFDALRLPCRSDTRIQEVPMTSLTLNRKVERLAPD
jgi:hypothetical protein